jgi:hypothetical protein
MPRKYYASSPPQTQGMLSPAGEISMRKELNDIVTKYGHFCVLRQFLRGEPRLDSYDEVYDEADREALRRLSSGRAYVDHLVIARKRTVVPGFESTAPIGTMSSPGIFFYVQAEIIPNKEDFMLEIALGRDAEPVRPYHVTHFYNIMDTDDLRDRGGELSFFRVRVEERSLGGTA